MRIEILHPFPVSYGFGKRLHMLCDELQKEHELRWTRTFIQLPLSLARLFFGGRAKVLCYTSLMAPLFFLLRLFRPGHQLFYLLRGDEAGEALHAGRKLRARVALSGQRQLRRMGARFIYVSRDLQDRIEERIGPAPGTLLPNTLGRPVPDTRPLDRRIGLVGDFGTVKNIEHVLEELRDTSWELHLFGNRELPRAWRLPNLVTHGMVPDLVEQLRKHCSLVVLSSSSEGFPNVLLEALEAGCSVLLHDRFPFRHLPLAPAWRYQLKQGSLRERLDSLLGRDCQFKQENQELVELVIRGWGDLLREALQC